MLGGVGRHRVQGRQVHREGHDKAADFTRAGVYRPQVQRSGTGAGPEGKRLLGSDQLHLPGWRAHLRVEIDPATGVVVIERWTAVDDFPATSSIR